MCNKTFIKPHGLSRNFGCTGIKTCMHRSINTSSLITYLLVYCQNYPHEHCPKCTRTDRDVDQTTTRDQSSYQRRLHYRPWITVSNHGSDTNTSKNTGSRSPPTCPCMAADDCHLKPDFIITLQYSATNTNNSSCTLICGNVAYDRFG